MVNSRFNALIIFFLLFNAVARGEGEAVDAWVSETIGVQGSFPRVVAVVTSYGNVKTGEAPQFMVLDKTAFDRSSYLRLAHPASAAWDYKLNARRLSQLDPMDAVLRAAAADAILFAPPSGKWQLIKEAAGQKYTLINAAPPAQKNAEGVVKWIFGGLGWDGVVLEHKGDTILVGSLGNILAQGQVQSLAIGNSAGRYMISAAERQGAGLLSLAQRKYGYGIFDVVFLGQGVSKLEPGTKLIIERKK
jgi:hypothetical protein